MNNNKKTQNDKRLMNWSAILTICMDSEDRYLDEFAYPFGVAEAFGVAVNFAHVTYSFADCTDTSVRHMDAFVRCLDEWHFVVDAVNNAIPSILIDFFFFGFWNSCTQIKQK